MRGGDDDAHLCCITHKKKTEKPIFRTNLPLEALLPPFFVRTTFRNSAITPASLLIRKSSTLRFTLWCSHDSVAKREQFSCPLGTTSLLLKLENVVPGRWMFFLLLWPSIFFTAMSSTRTYVYFSKNLVPGM